MDWLRNYEGKRGIGYLTILTSSFSPSYCALFLLENNIYVKSDAAQAILTSISLGTLTGLLLSLPMIFFFAHENKTLDDQRSSLGIGFGFWLSLAVQVTALLLALGLDKNFYWYYSASIIGAASFAAAIWIITFIAIVKSK